MKKLTRPLATNSTNPILRDEPDVDRAGQYVETRTFIEYLAPEQNLAAGYWESETGRYQTVSDRWECFTILHGKCVVTSDDGQASTYGPGESGIIEKGFSGHWTTLEPLRKQWVVYR